MTSTNREEWLTQAAVHLNRMIAETTALKPAKKIAVSAGWPRNDRKGTVIGQCFAGSASKGTNHVFISPLLGTAAEVLPVLLHELIHAADDCENHHNGAFRKAWKVLGFIDKPTTSVPGKELKDSLREIARELGKYPHSKLTTMDLPAKQTTRMLKVTCADPECGYVLRTTAKWIEVGLPTCCCGSEMEVEEK